MGDIVDFDQAKTDKEQPAVVELIEGGFSHNCDKNRPYNAQQPLRDKMEIKGLTRRDIQDCMVLGILCCKDEEDYPEAAKLPRIYISEEGSKYYSFDELVESNESYGYSYLDAEKITYNALYGWDLDKIDPIAAVQNMAVYLEIRLGIYPILVDGELNAAE